MYLRLVLKSTCAGYSAVQMANRVSYKIVFMSPVSVDVKQWCLQVRANWSSKASPYYIPYVFTDWRVWKTRTAADFFEFLVEHHVGGHYPVGTTHHLPVSGMAAKKTKSVHVFVHYSPQSTMSGSVCRGRIHTKKYRSQACISHDQHLKSEYSLIAKCNLDFPGGSLM